MTKHRPQPIEPPVSAAALRILRIPVAPAVAIDLFANAALRWLCRAGVAPGTRIVGVSR